MVALLPPQANVGVISPATEDGRALLRWAEAEDPALTLTTMRPPDSKTFALPKVQHVPSYASWTPRLRDIPPPAPDASIPSFAAPAPVVLPRVATTSPSAPRKTSVFISDELEKFGALRVPDSAFTTSAIEAPDNVRFRIAVDMRGVIRFCFIVNSSGDLALDEQARRLLVQSRFEKAAAGENVDTWGVATIQWGSDVKRSDSTPLP
jgi:hypothetical protein